ncbi:MAG: hypothetical protein H6722_32955 [Sandaracinus sp.]|nr:hypothetical protein [Sandaracinus sp.]
MRIRILHALAGGTLVALASVTAIAQQAEVSPTRNVGEYAGVSPGTGNAPPRAGAVARARPAKLLTWPGFQATPGGGSRFFLQVSGPVQFETRSSQGRFEVVLKNTRAHLRNTFRPLDTRFFRTPVDRAKVERRRRDLAVVFQMRADSTPNVTQGVGENGYHFVYVDFPAGNWAIPSTTPAAGAAPAPQAEDDEIPPMP